MTKTDKEKRLKGSLKNAKAKLQRREARIAKLEARIADMEAELKKKRNEPCYGPRSQEYYKRIPGHQFSEFVIRYAILLRCETNASSRDVVAAIEGLAKLTHGLVDEVPTHNTIDNWVRKCGLDEIRHTPEALKDMDYAVVIDECMMIGSEKLLPVLAVPAEHQGRPLQLNDVKVIGFNVKPSWSAETVSVTLNQNIEAVGKKPSYTISDNGRTMSKAIGLSNYTWHRDISHTLAMFMERVYKDDTDFVDFNKKLVTCKQQYCMKEIAYLQSPSQRTKARFMNLSDYIRWADNMLQIFHKLSRHEREAFSFLRTYASFVEEMKEMVSCIHFIETQMKHNGLSKKTIAVCRRHVCRTVMCGNGRMRRVGQQILDYLAEEEPLLKDNETVNNSSDIIESIFGIFKYNQSPNKLNGVTARVLHLPVILAYTGECVPMNYNLKERLCRTKIRDINLWRDENLMENLVAKRITTLKTA